MQLEERRIARGGLPPDPEKLFSVVSRQVDRLSRLVEDMLDDSRSAKGRMTLAREGVDLGELTRELAERFSEQFRAAGSEYELHAENGLKGNWDRFRVEQVLANLFTNAIKYGDGKPVKVSFRAEERRAVVEVQ